MTKSQKKRAVVVGAGVVGAAVAWELQKRGREVALIDRDAPGRGASFGNMASIAVSEFMPIARPAVYRQMPGWLLDPEGPICIKPSYFPKLLPWFIKFLMASMPSRVHQLEAHGAALCARALQDTQTLFAELGLSDHLSDTGCLTLYAGQAEFNADRERIDMLERFAFEHQIIDGDALRALEPEISPVITKALILPGNRTVRDPYLLVQRLIERFETGGGSVLKAEVIGFDRAERIERVTLDNGTTVEADEVVICAGAFSAKLGKLLGDVIPLETERGYSTQIMDPQIELGHSIIWPAKAFMISPTAGGLRVGGTVEMAGLDAPPNYARAAVTVRRAREALPNLVLSQSTQWMRHRPALPDTIPVLSASAHTPGVFYATGHGHLGLTYAATSAGLMGQLMDGETPDIDIQPFRVDRF